MKNDNFDDFALDFLETLSTEELRSISQEVCKEFFNANHSNIARFPTDKEFETEMKRKNRQQLKTLIVNLFLIMKEKQISLMSSF